MTCHNSTTKQCSKCGEVKALSEFKIQKRRNGDLTAECKSCSMIANFHWRRTKKGLTGKIYKNQVNHSKMRGHNPPQYSLDELREWMFAQQIFHELYEKWVDSDYDKQMVPSCDRTDDSLRYSLNRLTIMTWRKNAAKADTDTINGVLKRNQKPVTQMNPDGTFIKEWYSSMQAVRETGFSQGHISACCRGERKTHKGFRWMFSLDIPIHNNRSK